MRKLLLLSAVFLFFTGCRFGENQTPDAERVIRDTVAENIFKNIYLPDGVTGERIAVSVSENDFPRVQQGDIKQLLERIKSAPQKFIINGSTANEVQAKRGTTLRFQPNSFTDESGNTVSEDVVIEVKECYSPEEMIRENVITQTSDELLESKAMLYMRAFNDKGKELRIKKDGKVQVIFPFKVKPRNSYAFYMQHENANWQLYTEPVIREPKFYPPVFAGSRLRFTDYLQQIVTYPDYAKANELSGKAYADVHINEYGTVTGVNAYSDYLIFKEELNGILKNLPVFEPATFGEHVVASTLRVRFEFNLRSIQQIKITTDPAEVTYTASEALKLSAVKNDATAYFTNTGWICFGKKVSNGSAKKADVIIPADAHTDVRIVTSGDNSIVHVPNFAGYCRSKDFTVNTSVKVLMVKCEDNKIFYSVTAHTLQSQNVIEPIWKKVEEADLLAALQTKFQRKKS
ncbi:MAG: hypothetical protein KIS94_12755 [Chitinophagales bacterium]|nr:hypothetical protein [Chitinophagales bacterium]